MRALGLVTLLAACKPSGLVEMQPDTDTDSSCSPANPQLGDIEFSGSTAEDDMVGFCSTYNGLLGNLTIEGDKITSVEPLSCLCAVGGSVEISHTLLINLKGLATLTEIDGSLTITDNPLESVQFRDLTAIGDDIVINNNLSLVETKLPSLIEVGGDFGVHHAGLDLGGFSALQTVGGDVVISEPSGEMEALKSVGGSMTFSDTDLSFVGSYDSLTSIGVDLTIEDNGLLSNVDGLMGLESIGNDLQITDNESLPMSAATDLRDAIGTSNIGGSVMISGNAP